MVKDGRQNLSLCHRSSNFVYCLILKFKLRHFVDAFTPSIRESRRYKLEIYNLEEDFSWSTDLPDALQSANMHIEVGTSV